MMSREEESCTDLSSQPDNQPSDFPGYLNSFKKDSTWLVSSN